MAIDNDVLELVGLLSTEGFGSLAGELLAELDLERTSEGDAGTVDDPVGLMQVEDLGGEEQVSLEGVGLVKRRYPPPREDREDRRSTGGDGVGPKGPQLNRAVEFIRSRLVDPLLAITEAEDLAYDILEGGGIGHFDDETTPMPFAAREEAFRTSSAPPRGSTGTDAASAPAAGGGSEKRTPSSPRLRIAFAGADADASTTDGIASYVDVIELQDVLARLLRRSS